MDLVRYYKGYSADNPLSANFLKAPNKGRDYKRHSGHEKTACPGLMRQIHKQRFLLKLRYPREIWLIELQFSS